MTNEQYDKAIKIQSDLAHIGDQRDTFLNSVDKVGFHSCFQMNPKIITILEFYKNELKEHVCSLIDKEIAAKQAEFDAL